MLQRLEMSNNVETWLPQEDANAKVLAWTQRHFEPEDRFLLAWDSNSLADPRVEEFAHQLRTAAANHQSGDPALRGIGKVVTPHEVLTAMVEHGVAREEAVARLTGILVGSGPLKVRLLETAPFSVDEMQRRLRQYASEELGVNIRFSPPLTVPSNGEKANETDVSNSNSEAAPEASANDSDQFRPSDWVCPPHDFQIQWRGIRPGSKITSRLITFAESLGSPNRRVADCFFYPGAPVAISISINDYANDHLPQTVEAVRRLAIESGIPPEELRLGGSPIARATLNREAARAVWNTDYPATMFHKRSPLILSAIVGTLLAFLMLHSIRLAILVLLTAGYTSLAILALVPATGHTLNTVLVVMPNLLLVLTMSGAIHLSNYWRHAVQNGSRDPIARAVQLAKEPTTMASVTTAIGLASLLTSVLSPVKEFGAYSAIGCLFSLFMVLVGFPAMIRVWPGKPTEMNSPGQDLWRKFGHWVNHHGTAVILSCLVLFGASVYGLRWFRTETKVIRYFPEPMRIVQDYNYLEDNLAGIVSLDVLIHFERGDDGKLVDSRDLFQRMELIRRLEARVKEVPGISGALSLADFRNATDEQPPRSGIARRRYNRRLQIAQRQIFQTQADLTSQFVQLAKTRLAIEKNGIPISIEPTTENRDGDEVWRIRVQSGVMTDVRYEDLLIDVDTALAQELQGNPGVNHLVTGMVPLFLRTQEAVLDSLIRSFAIAFAVIAVVMIMLLRSITAGLITMLPNLLPVGLVFGGISWYGIPVDIGTMITASVALGIAVDGTLHLLTWFREGVKQGLSRSDAIAQGLSHCGPAMWQTSTAISLGLLMLSFADLLLISRFGWLMAALIGAALVADVVYLPALLSGSLGSLIERSVSQHRDGTNQDSPEEASTSP